MTRIYLAAPYSHPEYKTRARRCLYATQAANRLMQRGLLVYSPLTHGHAIAALGGLGSEFDSWREHCLSILRLWAQELYVLKLPGWKDSIGVAAEMAEADKHGLPIVCISMVEAGLNLIAAQGE